MLIPTLAGQSVVGHCLKEFHVFTKRMLSRFTLYNLGRLQEQKMSRKNYLSLIVKYVLRYLTILSSIISEISRNIADA